VVPDYSTLLGKNYYPIDAGRFIVYQVDSTVFTEIPRDTIHFQYQIKERIADSFTDDQGQAAIRLERFIKRFDPTKTFDAQPWTIKDVYVIRADDRRVERQEDNIRFVKLIFPIQVNAAWNGNVANTLGEQIYVYDTIEMPEVINQIQLDKVLKVRQLESVNLIEAEIATEKYAKDLGLVYKEHSHVKGNAVVAGKTVFERIESGYIYKQKIVSHGSE
jgi:hypothetical protein